MCGLVAVISSAKNGFTDKEVKAFSDMLYVDALRGEDSTGVFSVSNKNEVVIHKEASHAVDFMNSSEFSSFKKDLLWKGKIAVGHNRAATKGAVNDKNAHPFVVDDKIILVQNGTYRGCHKHHKDVDVDTEAVAHVVAEHDSISDALKKINAAYALIWYNYLTKTLHCIRNTERPLYIAYTKTGTIFLASESATIAYVCMKHNIELKGAPYLIKEGNLCSFTLTADKGIDEDYKEIEYKYVHKQYAVSTNVIPMQHHPRFDAHQDFNRGADHCNSITYNFKERFLLRYPEYLIPTPQVHNVFEMANDVQKLGDNVYIDTMDYFPANGRADCTVWFVFGTLLASDDPLDKLVCYWIVDKHTEDAIMNYTASNTGHMGLMRSTQSLSNGKGQSLVTCFIANVTKATNVYEEARRAVH